MLRSTSIGIGNADDLTCSWFFPPSVEPFFNIDIRLTRSRGIPHSLQGLKGGVEFLLVFDDGEFSEDNTFLASEIFARNPVSIKSSANISIHADFHT